ncbi:MAG: carbohydrate kinase [Aigarchaeota archaeon]|nr:carbohydrate kinase [Candidatus Calditenuaceae archaeon]
MIFAIGEVLVDFIAVEETDLKYVKNFEKHAGGAPANMVVGLRRLGVPAGLISKVGKDALGDFLLEELMKEGVNISGLKRDEEYPTGVAFVQLKGGRPEFLLYDWVAYFNLKIDDIDFQILGDAELIHFGGVLLSRELSRSTTLTVVEWARERRIPVSFDANIRPHLWRDLGELSKSMKKAFELSNVVKLGADEFDLLRKRGVDPTQNGADLISITRGDAGSIIIHKDLQVDIPPFKVDVVDTTGAGDSFMAAVLASLYSMSKLGDIKLAEDELRLLGKFSNLVAAISTTRRGAWSTPSLNELEKYHEIKTIVKKLYEKRGRA